MNVSEQSRRMEEMMKLYSMSSGGNAPSFPLEMKMIINTSSALIDHLSSVCETDIDKAEKIAKQIFYLSLMSQRNLTAEEMKNFLDDSYGILKNY